MQTVKLLTTWLFARAQRELLATRSYNVTLFEVRMLKCLNSYIQYLIIVCSISTIERFLIIRNVNVLFIHLFAEMISSNPCQPSPCGPHSQCRVFNEQAVCSCLLGFRGAPPSCRPECVASSDCPLDKACSNQKCINPCQGTCGVAAKCQVVNHNPICSCPSRMTGDPFTRCTVIRK